MAELTDTQAFVLSAAARRDGQIALPLPDSLPGGAAYKVVGAMRAMGVLGEVDARNRAGRRWRKVGGYGRACPPPGFGSRVPVCGSKKCMCAALALSETRRPA